MSPEQRAGQPDEAPLEELRGVCEDDRAYRQVRTIWELTRAPHAPDDRERLWRRIEDLERMRRKRASRRRPFMAAAGVVLGLGLGVGGFFSLRDGRPAPSVVAVPAGAVATINLGEGIEARLNAASRLSYARVSDTRVEVDLDGEAYFDVESGHNRTLVIRTEAGVVQNTGTQFNVRARNGRVSVAVVRGAVTFRAGGREVLVRSGEASMAAVGRPPSEPDTVDLFVVRAWLDGILVFYDTPLREVVPELERHYAVRFELTPGLEAQRLTAVIRSKSAAAAAGMICTAVGARCVARDGGWIISGQ